MCENLRFVQRIEAHTVQCSASTIHTIPSPSRPQYASRLRRWRSANRWAAFGGALPSSVDVGTVWSRVKAWCLT